MRSFCHFPTARDFLRFTDRRSGCSGLGSSGRPGRSAPSQRDARYAIVAGLCACLAALALAAAPVRAEDTNEIKADMLWNIAKFIRWPDNAFARGESDFVFTILGDDSLAEALAANLSTKTLSGRPVFVRVVGRVQDVIGSQIIYVASSALGRFPDVIRELRGAPALTVANARGFVEGGGMVDFIDEDEKVRFEIHQARAEKAGLKISARLLAIARVIDTDPSASR